MTHCLKRGTVIAMEFRRGHSYTLSLGNVLPAFAMFVWSVCPLQGIGSGPSDGALEISQDLRGEEVASRCNECHGEGGHSETPDIPSIAGFSMLATMDLLDTYRMGLRKARTVTLPDGSETNMEEVANSLSDDDEWAIVIYYANQEWRSHDQAFDAAVAKRGAEIHAERCERCHYDGGRDPESDLPLSAGQWREYLVAEFDNFDSGRRAMSEKMKEKYDTLSAADKQAIIELYVSAGNY